MAFYIAGTPQPTPVKNADTGLVENGYRLTVVDTETGARAVLEIPQSQYNPTNVETLANYYLGLQNDVLAKFGAKAAGLQT